MTSYRSLEAAFRDAEQDLTMLRLMEAGNGTFTPAVVRGSLIANLRGVDERNMARTDRIHAALVWAIRHIEATYDIAPDGVYDGLVQSAEERLGVEYARLGASTVQELMDAVAAPRFAIAGAALAGAAALAWVVLRK